VDDRGGSPEATVPTPEQSIRGAIAREEAKIERLERELKETRVVLERLKAELSAQPPSSSSLLPLTPGTRRP